MLKVGGEDDDTVSLSMVVMIREKYFVSDVKVVILILATSRGAVGPLWLQLNLAHGWENASNKWKYQKKGDQKWMLLSKLLKGEAEM